MIALTNWKRTYTWLRSQARATLGKTLTENTPHGLEKDDSPPEVGVETTKNRSKTNYSQGAKLLAVSVIIALSTSVAEARPRPTRSSESFEANKTFGLGLMLGVPSGLSAKYYLSEDTALDFGLGLYGRYRNDSYDRALHFHIDHLWHPVVLAKPDAFWMPLYLGIGARILDHRGDRDLLDDMHLGLRAPLGILLDFTNVPLDIFLELALVVDVLHDGNHGYSDINLSLGLRYYFN